MLQEVHAQPSHITAFLPSRYASALLNYTNPPPVLIPLAHYTSVQIIRKCSFLLSFDFRSFTLPQKSDLALPMYDPHLRPQMMHFSSISPSNFVNPNLMRRQEGFGSTTPRAFLRKQAEFKKRGKEALRKTRVRFMKVLFQYRKTFIRVCKTKE